MAAYCFVFLIRLILIIFIWVFECLNVSKPQDKWNTPSLLSPLSFFAHHFSKSIHYNEELESSLKLEVQLRDLLGD